MPRKIEDLPTPAQALLTLPLADGHPLEPMDLHSGLAFDMALLFAEAWTKSTSPTELIAAIPNDYAQARQQLHQWYEAVCKTQGILKPWVEITNKERAEELAALMGVEVADDPYDIGYWCRWAQKDHPNNPRYSTASKRCVRQHSNFYGRYECTSRVAPIDLERAIAALLQHTSSATEHVA